MPTTKNELVSQITSKFTLFPITKPGFMVYGHWGKEAEWVACVLECEDQASKLCDLLNGLCEAKHHKLIKQLLVPSHQSFWGAAYGYRTISFVPDDPANQVLS